MIWALVRAQHGVISWWQLRSFRFSEAAIEHRVARGRLHELFRGVYAVGRPDVTREGMWMAAVLVCGKEARLAGGSGLAFLGMGFEGKNIEISVPYPSQPEHEGIVIHRRKYPVAWGRCEGIPVLAPVELLVDLAATKDRDALEAAINAADRLNLAHPPEIRDALDSMRSRRGIRILKNTLDQRTFVFTDSKLERYYLPLSDRAGLPRPQTQRYLGSYRVDFLYPFGMVVETDGLRYHRTAAQQTKDLERSQEHTANGLVPLRFSHAQIRYDPDHVIRILRATGERLMG